MLDAARSGRAIILLFFGHEGRSLRISSRQDREAQSGYDLILEFMRNNNLPPGAVWFISGNLQGHKEYRTWKSAIDLGAKIRLIPFKYASSSPFPI